MCGKISKLKESFINCLVIFKIINNVCCSYLVDFLPLQVSERTTYSLRMATNLSLLVSCTECFKRSFFPLLQPCGVTFVLAYVASKPLPSFSFYNVLSYNATYDFASDRFNHFD